MVLMAASRCLEMMPHQHKLRRCQSQFNPAVCGVISAAKGCIFSRSMPIHRDLRDLSWPRRMRDETMGEISLRMVDGTDIVVPSSLEAITTYVILEQEKWF